MDLQFWLVFITSALALNIAPGPDLVYILTKSLSGGKAAGLVSILGLATGALIHVILSALGVTLILKSSVLAFNLVKLLGAGYLFLLAYQTMTDTQATSLTSKNSNEIPATNKMKEPLSQVFKQGILVDLFNPKVALFFMAYLPAFIRNDAGSIPLQLIYLGVLVILIAIFVETFYVALSVKLTHKIKQNTHFKIYIDRLVAIIFTLLAIKLLFSVNT